MSKSNIYETNWTNLVFENKNKEYGAYQLRQENSKTTITALFMGLLLLAGIGSVSMLINKFRVVDPVEATEPDIYDPITPVDLAPIPVEPVAPKPIAPPQQAPAAPAIGAQLTHPVIVPVAQATPEIAPNTSNSTAVLDNNSGAGTSTNVLPASNGGEGTLPSGPTITDPVNPATLDKMPDFPGGMSKFYSYVGNNFNKPELDAEKTLRVYVSFVIEKDGSITDIMVKNDPGYGMGKEAVRVLKSLKTKWIPGMIAGKPVRTAYNLPITIKTEME
ncbi:energy transducer TonB [Flavobacterium sp. KJJ]|uniref:energy transducer TonB n=1 Tax=Flavobacterium sp. KJJ TaxID=1270193 RepID=UPI0004939B8B|nr:energy transducer TonB [Flavobacterium sp. KJJ]